MPKRGPITRVACEPCRARKIRCNGTTPICGPCRGRNEDCRYASDPTVSRAAAIRTELQNLRSSHEQLLELYRQLKWSGPAETSALLDRIKKEDVIPQVSEEKAQSNVTTSDNETETETVAPSQSAFSGVASSSGDDSMMRIFSSAPAIELTNGRTIPQTLGEASERSTIAEISVSHKVFLWPSLSHHMSVADAVVAPDLQRLARFGSPWLLRKDLSRHPGILPSSTKGLDANLDLGANAFSRLTTQQVSDYSTAYFYTFNRLFPLLDSDVFTSQTKAKVIHQGNQADDQETVLVLLVLALGQLAVEGVLASPIIGKDDSEQSGFRGGTIEQPPGLGLFNEARRRMGMIATKCRLENVQIMLLQATYFEASARHSDFWSSISAASMACIFLIKSQAIEWSSHYGDLVKRAFWICVLHERSFDLEFRVASTGIEELEDRVPLPHFPKIQQEELQSIDYGSYATGLDAHSPQSRQNDYAYHFTAMIALSRLIRRADSIIHDYEPAPTELESSSQSPESSFFYETGALTLDPKGFTEPPTGLLWELVHQLNAWRAALPPNLQWNDVHRFAYQDVEPLGPLALASHHSSFEMDRDSSPGVIDHNVDIAVAHLRTCFYQARFLIHRPFVYKALHRPDLLTAADRSSCAFAIDAACMWPLSLSPPNNKKHLVPHLFSWTQNFLAMMLVLRTCQEDEVLLDICREGSVSEVAIQNSIISMRKWLKDVSQADGIADWGVQTLIADDH